MEKGAAFALGERVVRACRVKPYELQPRDPTIRPLQIFALDPSESRLHGNMAKVSVPYEPLDPGPIGRIFEVDLRAFDAKGRVVRAHPALDLEHPRLMLAGGMEPTQSDPRFHAQMVYAVCSTLYRRFRQALGRTVAWGFTLTDDNGKEGIRLRIKPLGTTEKNAYYDPDAGELVFGYYETEADEVSGRNHPNGTVFTCLGHDIVAHECTHALLDGLRAHFVINTHPDVAAFHEGFADIVALLHRFSHQEVVRQALRASRGRLDAEHLTQIGLQFGQTSGDFGPIRNVIDYKIGPDGVKSYPLYSDLREPHDRGRVLCAAIYDAFVTIYERKVARYKRMATGGSGVVDPEAELPHDLLSELSEQACTLAGQFLNICIRAIDYCPPVDVRFGDYLRAVITADLEVVRDDPWGYREAWIDAFQRRGIFPRDVKNLGEDALMWGAPRIAIPHVKALSFSELAFDGDPGRAPRSSELIRQATEVGRMVTTQEYREEFGLVDPHEEHGSHVVTVDVPRIESVRATRRVGPDGNIVFDTVAEVTQRYVVRKGQRKVEIYGGSTVLIDAWGGIRFVVRKRVLHERREEEAFDYIDSPEGRMLWKDTAGTLQSIRSGFKLIHEQRLNG